MRMESGEEKSVPKVKNRAEPMALTPEERKEAQQWMNNAVIGVNKLKVARGKMMDSLKEAMAAMREHFPESAESAEVYWYAHIKHSLTATEGYSSTLGREIEWLERKMDEARQDIARK
jgi:hypothetical protein